MGSRGRVMLGCVLAAMVTLAGCESSNADGTGQGSDTPDSGLVRMAVVGDSITAGDSPDLIGGDVGQESWVAHATGDGLVVAGGWAMWGATSSQMAQGVEPVDADVLVVLAGTNDISSTVPFDETAANIATIVETVGAPRVILSAVPPTDSAPELAVQLNADLEALAEAREWEYVDAPAGLREEDQFAEGMTRDGVHPTADGAQVIGEAIRAVILGEA